VPKRGILAVLAAAAVLPAAGCGKSGGTKTTTGTTTSANAPQIVKFDGPSAVPCGKKRQIKSVSFRYATRNANAVEPSVDHQAIGAQAGYDPRGGTMRFPYICPGPHIVTISAFGHGKTASRSVTLEPESSG
jgi:hypothetical protein